MKKILIIGLGSIGLKHFKILKKINKKFDIRVLSKNKIKNVKYINEKGILAFAPNYIIISNHTSKHFRYLNLINNSLKKVKILVEKPLFHKPLNLRIKNNNKIFVGYNLRFSSVIEKLKELIKKENFFYSSLTCYSFLPGWRKNINYTLSNSAKKNYGGGVANELSHEIDLVNYLFDIKKIHSSFSSKISKLNIETDDILNLNTFCKKVKFCSLNINFFDKQNERKIKIIGKEHSYEVDILNNLIKIFDNKNHKIKKIKTKKNNTYEKLHKSVINNDYRNICDLKHAQKILKIIFRIKNG